MTSPILSLLNADMVKRYTDAGFWRGETIYDVVRDHAGWSPDRVAVRDCKRSLSYAALVDAADALAHDLSARGVKRGQRVVVWLPSRIEALVAFVASSRNGYVVCLSPHRNHTVAEVASFVKRLRAAALIYEAGFGADADRNDLGETVRELRSLRHVYRLTSDDPAPWPSRPSEIEAERAIAPSDDPDAVIYVMFTSGSTGQPKGVMHSDNTLLTTARAIVRDWRLDAGTVVYALSPHSHSLGVGAILTAFAAGGQLVMHDQPRGESLIDRLVETGATYLVGVPTHSSDLLEEMRRRDMRSGVGKVMGFRISGAAAQGPVVAELLQRGVLPQRGYGMTEVNSHQYSLPGDDETRIVETSGKCCPEHEVRIWRTDDPDREVEAGEIGEIGSRGASLMLGYFDDQLATEAAFNAHGWFMTGDLGWLDENGYLRVTGRKKDVIIRGGHNVNPARIEDLAMQYDTIERAAAIPLADPRLGERICLAVKFRAGQTAAVEQVLGHLVEAGLSKYEMPEFFVTLDDVPLMPNGKVQKAEIVKWVRDGRLKPSPVRRSQ